LVATVTTAGAVTNTARKTAQNEPDPNTSNDVSSAIITGTGLPGAPNGGMGRVFASPARGGAPGGGLLVGAAFAGIFGVLFLWRRSHRVAIAAGLMAVGTLLTIAGSVPSPSTPTAARMALPSPSEGGPGGGYESIKPVIGERALTLYPAVGPVTPYRLRIPALQIDAVIEPVGVTRKGLMDVPRNLWDAAWLKTGVRPGALGQAVLDGHLDGVQGSALFADLHRLKPGDRIYVSDASGGELTFAVTVVQVEPLRGFPTLAVFGPASGRFLNLITCAGTFDPAGHTYDHRLVVFTQLA
jgi:hypothetical protein